VETHWGGYNAFFVDITDYIQIGTNEISVRLSNNVGNILAPYTADFNFNATLGSVKLLTSPVLPDKNYGYDGFHVTADVTSEAATVRIKTSIPTYANVICHIDDDTYHFTQNKLVKGEVTFTAVINNPHLWDGINDPHLYNITLEIYYNDELYYKLHRDYGLRYYSYEFNNPDIDGYDSENPFTGFLLNGHPYLLRGVCMHNDLVNKANALTVEEMNNDFDVLRELGANIIRTAHYPHPKQFYDYCDKLGIVVQTEVPCVNNIQATMPAEYYEHLTGQYIDMVNQHYNHPCIFFWGLSNEAHIGDLKDSEGNLIITGKEFARQKCNEYTALIKSIDPYRWVGYVLHQNAGNPS
jgi:beta-galactosidase